MHIATKGDTIYIVEREWFDRLCILVCHFALGPIWGVNQQIDPDTAEKPNRGLALLILVNLGIGFYLAPQLIRLGILWTVVNPAALYIFSTIPETVYEHRAYLGLLGMATLGAWAAERVPVLVAALVALYLIRTIKRNIKLGTHLGYWTLAYEESPDFWRARYNYAQQLQTHGRELEALPLLHTLFEAPRPCGETAAQHAVSIYLKHGMTDEAELLLGSRGSAILRFPNNKALRVLRVNMLRMQGHDEQANVAEAVAGAMQ